VDHLPTVISKERPFSRISQIQRIRCQPGDLYEVIFLDHQDSIVVPLTEWYRQRQAYGSKGTRETYLTCLLPYLSFLIEQGCSWNAPPERLRPVLLAFYRDRLGCQLHPRSDQERVDVALTRETPVCASTLRVMRAALRDFYGVLKDAGLYAFANPLSSETLIALKREQMQTVENRGAPDHAGIRGETREQSRRRPTAFLHHSEAEAWKPALRKELADVREGIHRVLDALIDSETLPLREKAVLELLRNTGARLHEIVSLSVGGYRNAGLAGQAKVVNKGSFGREVKTVHFAHNPRVERLLTTYLKQVRPLHDPHGRTSLSQLEDTEPFFLTARHTPYSVKSFYWSWYRAYEPLQALCPVRFSVHDIRHLFVSEFLITLRLACGFGTDRFDAERYLREREAFGGLVMGWQSPRTIDIYDQSRDGERTLAVLSTYQQKLSQRCYLTARPCESASDPIQKEAPRQCSEGISQNSQGETLWVHDSETLDWIKKMQRQSKIDQ
jgi:hypothetical protein